MRERQKDANGTAIQKKNNKIKDNKNKKIADKKRHLIIKENKTET